MVTASKSCEFLFLYCLVFIVGYELAAIFMSGDVLSSVALFMGELYMVWNSWANLFCSVSINCECLVKAKSWKGNLLLALTVDVKKVAKFLQKVAKLKFLFLWLDFGFGFGTWVSKF
jgi:hypothetical protein